MIYCFSFTINKTKMNWDLTHKEVIKDIFQNIVIYKKISDIPLVPPEFIDQEPTLNDLNDFVIKYNDAWSISTGTRHFGKIITDGLKEYTNNLAAKWSCGCYYLLGQLPILPTQRLDSKILNHAIGVHKERFVEYGGAVNSAEQWSIHRHEHLFNMIKSLIQLYYNVKIEEYYAPGGDGFIDAMKRFNERNY